MRSTWPLIVTLLFTFGAPAAADARGNTPHVRCPSGKGKKACVRANRLMDEAERHRRRGATDHALQLYAQARDLLPTSAVPCLRGAALLLDFTEPERLLDYARCAREREPKRPLPYLFEGVALQVLGRNSEAARLYAIFASMAPDDPRAEDAIRVSAQLLESRGAVTQTVTAAQR